MRLEGLFCAVVSIPIPPSQQSCGRSRLFALSNTGLFGRLLFFLVFILFLEPLKVQACRFNDAFAGSVDLVVDVSTIPSEFAGAPPDQSNQPGVDDPTYRTKRGTVLKLHE